MNTKICKFIHQYRGKGVTEDLFKLTQELVDGHNAAVKFGFLELPLVVWRRVDVVEQKVVVTVAPRAGFVDLDDLYNLKQAWGAECLEVCSDMGLTIQMTF